MRPFLIASVVMAGLVLSPQMKADVLTLDIQFDLSLVSGGDGLGLDGATANLLAQFAEGTTYSGTDPFPLAVADSHSIVISGATVASSNGTTSDPNGLTFQPSTSSGDFFDTLDNLLLVDVGTGELEFGLLLDAPAVLPSVGDFMSASDFAGPDLAFSLFFASDGSEYEIAGGTYVPTITGSTVPDAAAVPEPSTFAFLGLGATGMCFAAFRRKRKRS